MFDFLPPKAVHGLSAILISDSFPNALIFSRVPPRRFGLTFFLVSSSSFPFPSDAVDFSPFDGVSRPNMT